MPDLQELNIWSICLRITLSLVLGGILGSDRGRKNRPAGFRTYMLVCLGAALVMMTNQYVFQEYGGGDPVRMGAQVVSGIGFLGAGTILITGKSQVKGITTAAGLWAAACAGLAIGIGFYSGALIGGIAIFLVMTVMRRLDAYIHKNSSVIDLYIEFDTNTSLGSFLEYARENQFDISDIQMTKNKYIKDLGVSVILSAKSQVRRKHAEITGILSSAPGVEHLEEL